MRIGESHPRNGDATGTIVTFAYLTRARITGKVNDSTPEGLKGVRLKSTKDGSTRDLMVDGHEDGFWVGPTVIDHVGSSMDVYTEEIFGPVLSVLRVDTVDLNQYAGGVRTIAALWDELAVALR